MTRNLTRFGLAIGATAIAMLMVVANTADTAAQNSSGQDPAAGRPAGPGRGGRGGPGGFGGPGRGGPMGRGGPLGIRLDQLDLTAAQQEQVHGIMQSREPEMQALRERAQSAHQALDASIAAEVFDEGAIRARSADVAAVDVEVAVAQARTRGEVFQLLTPEQRTKANQPPRDRRPPPQRGQPF